jgi:hypothetical protein
MTTIRTEVRSYLRKLPVLCQKSLLCIYSTVGWQTMHVQEHKCTDMVRCPAYSFWSDVTTFLVWREHKKGHQTELVWLQRPSLEISSFSWKVGPYLVVALSRLTINLGAFCNIRGLYKITLMRIKKSPH